MDLPEEVLEKISGGYKIDGDGSWWYFDLAPFESAKKTVYSEFIRMFSDSNRMFQKAVETLDAPDRICFPRRLGIQVFDVGKFLGRSHYEVIAVEYR